MCETFIEPHLRDMLLSMPAAGHNYANAHPSHLVTEKECFGIAEV